MTSSVIQYPISYYEHNIVGRYYMYSTAPSLSFEILFADRR